MARSRGGEIIISWSLELNETANDNAAHNKEPNKEAKDDAKQINASFTMLVGAHCLRACFA